MLIEDDPVASGQFGFDTLSSASSVALETFRLQRNPITEAHRLFGLATTEAPLLLSSVGQNAAAVVRRVVNGFRQGNSSWKHMLNADETDILGRENRKGIELARLFLLTPEISENDDVQDVYTYARREVVQAFVEQFLYMTREQIAEVYEKFGLTGKKDGTFEGQSMLRRVAQTVYH